jgi:lauroyl/myristoyl acyltransferase
VIPDSVRFRVADLLARMLPRFAAYALAERLADAEWRRDGLKRIAVERNLRRICGASGRSLSKIECVALSREAYRSFARRLVDSFRIGRMSRASVTRLVNIEGLSHLDAALALGRGVIAFSAHLGFNELPGPVLTALGYDISAVYLPMRDPATDSLFTRRRSRRFATLIPLGAAFRPCLEALRRRAILAIAADVDYSLRTDLVTFFGSPARLPRGPARLAVTARAPLVPGFIHSRADGGYLLRFHPPIVPDEHTTPRDLQESIVRMLETEIAADPAAWWVFYDFWDIAAGLAVSRAEGVT